MEKRPLPYVWSLGFSPEQHFSSKTTRIAIRKTRIRATIHLEVPDRTSGRSAKPVDQRLGAIQRREALLNVP